MARREAGSEKGASEKEMRRRTARVRGRGRTRSGPRVGDVQYCSNDAEAAPLATIFSLYLLGIHLVLYSGLLHFIPASLPCPLSVSHFLSLLVSLSTTLRSRAVREDGILGPEREEEKPFSPFCRMFVRIQYGRKYFFFFSQK